MAGWMDEARKKRMMLETVGQQPADGSIDHALRIANIG